MKKVLIALAALLLVAAVGYVAFFMEDTPLAAPADTAPADAPADAQPKLDVRKKAETPADVLEALDYEMTQNSDTVGWLRVPGLEIDDSVLQSHDNVAYLRRDERRREDVYGCYFADYACSVGAREDLSPNIVIYGHSDLKDNPGGPRFSQLFRFTDPVFARNTPVIHFSTLENFMSWQVFAVFYTSTDFDYISADPLEGLTALAAEAKARSLYDYGVDVGPSDHILTLSTCTVKYGAEDTTHRFVVMAKLLPEGAEPLDGAELVEKDSTTIKEA